MIERTGDTVPDETVSRRETVGAAGCFRGHLGNMPGLWVSGTTRWCYFFPAEPGRDQGIYDALGAYYFGRLKDKHSCDMVLSGAKGKGSQR